MKLSIKLTLLSALLLSVLNSFGFGLADSVYPRPLASNVQMYKGRATIFINNQPETPIIYSLTDSPGGRWTWEEFPRRNLQNFSNAGIKIFQVSIWFQDIWSPGGNLDMELVRRQLRGVLDVDPQAGIMIRFHINAPFWWNDANPDECTQYADGPWEQDTPIWGLQRHIKGDLDRRKLHSFASVSWREITTSKIREFCRLLSAMPEGNAVIALHPADGVSHEWHYWGFIRHDPDTGPAMTKAFKAWLQRKYKNKTALRKAWNDRSIDFDLVVAPDTSERRFTSDGVFRDPAKERTVIDYFECQQELLADNIIHFCRTIKESWPRPIITGVFYGYFFMMFSRQATGGHLEMDRMLRSPYIDYFSAPQSYWGGAREMGGSGQSRGLIESCHLHKKLWLEEMDQATRVNSASPESESDKIQPGMAEAINDDITIMTRNLAHPFARGAGLWFYDFGPNQRSGSWDHPGMLSKIKELKSLYDSVLHEPYQSDADVLIVYDDKSYYQFHSSWNPISENSIDQFSGELHRSGAMFDNVYLTDLPLVELKKYKIIIFANVWVITKEQRKFINENILNQNLSVLWNYMPGYSNEEKLSIDHVADLVQMKLERLELKDTPAIQLKPIHNGISFALRRPVSPLVHIVDSTITPMGWYNGTTKAAIGKKKVNETTIWFSTLPLCDAATLRSIIKESGAHIYNDQKVISFSGGNLLTVHTKEGGNVAMQLKSGKPILLQLPMRSTTILNQSTGEILLSSR